MTDAPSQEELEAAHCWLAHDEVPRQPEMTQFRRAVRYHHAVWREANGYPIGARRSRPGTPPRSVGSQLDLEFARESGATFLTAKALAAAPANSNEFKAALKSAEEAWIAAAFPSDAAALAAIADRATASTATN